LILSVTLLLCSQQFVGGWTFSGPHTDATEIANAEKAIVKGRISEGFSPLNGDSFWGTFDVAHDVGEETAKASAFYQHKIVAEKDGVLHVRMGSDDGIKVWLNGELLLDHNVERGNNPSAEHLALPLISGENQLAIRIMNAGGAWSFSINAEKSANPIDVDRAIRKGTDWLIYTQMLDGSWGHLQSQYRNGATALALYALLRCGVSPESAAVQKGISFISAAYPEKTYSAGCHLMALAELNDPEYYEQMEVIASDLISWQEKNGNWAYPGGHWDLSCTQFAILGLNAATKVGIQVPAQVWRDAIAGILLFGAQFDAISRIGPDTIKRTITGFKYRPNYTSGGTLSMTTAAIASIGVCLKQLGGKYPQKTRKEIKRTVAEGMAWINHNFTVARNYGFSSHHFYTLYGIERVGAAYGISHFGEHDWYNNGATFLVDAQHQDGYWPDKDKPSSLTDTAFALIFLKRASAAAAVTGGKHSNRGKEFVSEELDGRLRLHVNYGDPVVMWASLPDGAQSDTITYSIKRSANSLWQEIGSSSETRFALTHTFPAPGKWLVKAECAIDGETVNSTDLVYYYVPPLGVNDTGYGDDEFENLIPAFRPSYEVSSRSADYFDGDNLFDGSLGTRWFCKGNDPNPEFTISLKRSARATKLLFSHVYTSAKYCIDNARPSEIEIYINKDKQPIVIQLNPNQNQKTIYTFDKKVSVKTLRVVITKIINGSLGSAGVGFSQVELQR
jgi:hypothetical protein